MIKINFAEVKKETFPNGETRLDLKPFIDKDAPGYVVQWKYESDADFATLAFIADYLHDNIEKGSTQALMLDIFYMPYSRMDRSENGSVFTLKTAAKLINQMNFKFVTVVEPHSAVTLELLERSSCPQESVHLALQAVAQLKKQSTLPVYLFYPDKGAEKRYETVAGHELKDFPFLTGAKKRDFNTGRIVSYEISNPENCKHGEFNIVIIDDLTSYGGTFVAAAKLLREFGAESIILAVAHAEEAAFQGELFDYIDGLYTTNSITSKESFEKDGKFAHISDLFKLTELTEEN